MKKLVLTTLAAASLIGAVALTATAERGHGPKGPMLENLDVNGDGAVSKAEIEASKAERFSSADLNGDNLMSFDEFEAHIEAEKARREAKRRERHFARLDTDGDGFVSAEEHAAAGGDRMERMFNRLDADDDGVISEDEREAAKAKMKERRGKRGERGERRWDRD